MLNKLGKLAYLRGEYDKLNQIAFLIQNNIILKGYVSQEEYALLQQLRGTINSVQSQGIEVQQDLNREVLVEIAKRMVRV